MSTAEAQLVFSPRERLPDIVPTARKLAIKLTQDGRAEDAGWLLLALVAPELIRPERVAGPARALAQDAAEALAQSRQGVAASEVYLALGDRSRAAAILRRSGHSQQADAVVDPGEDPKLLVQRGLGSGPLIASVRRVRKRARRAFRDGTVTQANADRVLPLLQALGLYKSAGQLASRLGEHATAGECWAEAGDLIAAARSYHSADDSTRALRVLLDCSAEDPAYRQACVFAVRLAERLDQLDFGLYHLVGDFVAAGPADETERTTFKTLAELFDRMGQPQAADEIRAILGGRSVTSPPPLVDLSELPSLPPSPLDTTLEVATPIIPPAGRNWLGAGAPDERKGERRARSRSEPQERQQAAKNGDRRSMETDVLDLVGTVVGGRYYIDGPMRGSRGDVTVFKARDISLSEEVALRFLPGISGDRHALDRFRQEMSQARRLAHPNIARIVDMGDRDGTPFVCSELLHGVALSRLTRNELPLDRAIDALRQIAEGLSVAHDLDVVHLDLTLGKLFLTQTGTVKILGFGLAAAAASSGLAGSDQVAGSPVYLAPEQIADFQEASAAADQYALAVVAYHLLTGRPPFSHPELVPLLRMHAETRPAPPSSVEPTVPRQLDAVLLRALSKAPSKRYPSCRDLAADLVQAATQADVPA